MALSYPEVITAYCMIPGNYFKDWGCDATKITESTHYDLNFEEMLNDETVQTIAIIYQLDTEQVAKDLINNYQAFFVRFHEESEARKSNA
jgi:hypothetical protein